MYTFVTIDPFIFFSFNYVIWCVTTDPVPTWDGYFSDNSEIKVLLVINPG